MRSTWSRSRARASPRRTPGGRDGIAPPPARRAAAVLTCGNASAVRRDAKLGRIIGAESRGDDDESFVSRLEGRVRGDETSCSRSKARRSRSRSRRLRHFSVLERRIANARCKSAARRSAISTTPGLADAARSRSVYASPWTDDPPDVERVRLRRPTYPSWSTSARRVRGRAASRSLSVLDVAAAAGFTVRSRRQIRAQCLYPRALLGERAPCRAASIRYASTSASSSCTRARRRADVTPPSPPPTGLDGLVTRTARAETRSSLLAHAERLASERRSRGVRVRLRCRGSRTQWRLPESSSFSSVSRRSSPQRRTTSFRGDPSYDAKHEGRRRRRRHVDRVRASPRRLRDVPRSEAEQLVRGDVVERTRVFRFRFL